MIFDQRQISIKEKLRELSSSLERRDSDGFFKNFFSSAAPKSFYIYGDVGRGKSMLMKLFFNSLHKTPKIYFHFNSFMQLLHETLRDIRKEKKQFKDELIEAVKRLIGDKKVICFDEFQVTDIADAMLLSRIFSHLFLRNVAVVFTSNSHPLELYKNGLQRQVFLEFVNEFLLKNFEILHLDSPTDYRKNYIQNLSKRYFISNQENREEVKKILKNLTDDERPKPSKIKVWGREVEIKKTYPHAIAELTFDELCRVNFSAADYQAICKNFNLVFLSKIPVLGEDEFNEAKRFMLFIDEVYEKKVALVILSKAKPENIFRSGTGHQAFLRTVSRLNEIKSDRYWQESKLINQI